VIFCAGDIPTAFQTKKVNARKPYQQPAILDVLVCFFKRASDIMQNNSGEFQPTGEGYTEEEMPDALIAAAATIVSP
jgi:hypothetical protein